MICLITPPSVFLLDERVFMNLGILKVAAVLEKRGHSIEFLDLSGIQNYEDVASLYAASSRTMLFGITATTPQLPAAMNICRAIRSQKPGAKVILGGPHVTLVNAAYKKEKAKGLKGRAMRAFTQLTDMFDVLVAGDGEEAVFHAVEERSPKLVDADDSHSTLFLNNTRLNELPFPSRHLVDVESYHYTIDGVRALSMIAQLGCPFACGFCGGRESPTFRRIRMRTSENIVSEILHLYHTYKVTGFMLYDDELNVNPKMIELMTQIRKAQEALGVEFKLRGFIKAQLFTDAQAEAMFQAGFRWILTGFESGSPRILQNINKTATQEENTRCVEIARKHGLKVKALMSVGHPGESEETVMETHEWLLRVKPDDLDVAIITTYPGTPYYDHAVKHTSLENVWVYTYQNTGDRLYSYEVDYSEVADYYKGDPNGGYNSYVYTDFLSAEQLVYWRNFIESDIRKRLNIPFNPSAPAIRYEHSMGQRGSNLPSSILRMSREFEPTNMRSDEWALVKEEASSQTLSIGPNVSGTSK